MTSPVAIVGALVAALIGSFGSLYLKKASGSLKLEPWAIVTNIDLIRGFLFYGLSVIVFIGSLRLGELSVLYPLVATGYVWTSLLSMWYLREQMNTLKWIGVVVIILGVSFIGLGS